MLWLSHLERKGAPLASTARFFYRLGRNFLATVGIVAFSLTVGTLGYHYIGGVGWVDGFHNAAMILTGMGPVDMMNTTAAKLFATLYALFSGTVFLSTVAVLIAPVVHRFLHKFHVADTKDDDDTPAH